ncbi:hypothetical protein [Mycobacterium sp. D16R24]|uniref:hypothetical protein n=1 Tax=Mycobacterium sp. D16R24 TaxID=1855656 RepID=UPI002570999A|nr:hypothetical protein [Mycobacterium sp. D16R24]
MVKLHVNKLTTGQTVCTVMHNWGRGVWTETITGDLREGKEYARFEVQPGMEVRIPLSQRQDCRGNPDPW